MTAWSYSSAKTFEQCPKKYYHLKVAKDVKDEAGDAANYGTELHTAAEEYIRDSTPLPLKFGFIKGVLDSLNKIEGEKHCEQKLGVKLEGGKLVACDFWDEECWWRGVADLVILEEAQQTAHSIDYKSGKNANYADTKQLDLVAAGLFIKYPKLEVINSALAFVVSKDFITKVHTRELVESYFASFTPTLGRILAAIESGTWNAKSSPLCGYCPVVECSHNKRKY